jgi:prepilin-type N-terminal cleavage/methylation domain-containing protein
VEEMKVVFIVFSFDGGRSMRVDSGFSLIELLIVVAIIAIVAAIAIPNLQTSKQAANEAGAMQGCRTVGSAEIAYASTNNQQYTDIATLVNGNYLDARFGGTGTINGYGYAAGDVLGTALDGTPPVSFGFIATPANTMGRFIYSIAPDQIVRFQGASGGASLPSGITAGDPIGKTS